LSVPFTPPGWYPDPWAWPGWRYFDGIRWTNGYAPYYPAPPQAPAAEKPAQQQQALQKSSQPQQQQGAQNPSSPTVPESTAATAETATLRMDETPVFSRVRVASLGSLDTGPEDAELLGATVITWTQLEDSGDVFAEVEVRGIITPKNELHWLSGDAEVEVIEWPRYADQPENLIPQARPRRTPSGVNGVELDGMTVDTPDGWPPLVWKSVNLHSSIRGWNDPEHSVEMILCALAVAPDVGDLRPTLLAGLKARYARLARDARTYPPERYPWCRQDGPETDRWRH
jgi:hypothetical protein